MFIRKTRDTEPQVLVGEALALPQESRFVTAPPKPELDGDHLSILKKVVMAIPRRRLDRGLSWVCAIAGRDHTHKYHAALSLAAEIDPSFTINRYCFSPKELLTALEGSRPGQVFVFEETEITYFYPYRNLGIFAYEYKVGLIIVIPGRNNGWIPGALMIDLDTYICTQSPNIENSPDDFRSGVVVYWYQVMTPHLALYDDPYHLDYIHPEVDGCSIESLCIEDPPEYLVDNYHEVWGALVKGMKHNSNGSDYGDEFPPMY